MQLRLLVAGPGRAGGAFLLAAAGAGHDLVGVVSRRRDVGASPVFDLAGDDPLPRADLLVLAVRDDAIRPVARQLAPRAAAVGTVCHLSGFTSVDALSPFGSRIGSLHPLQSLPDPERGARALVGAWAAITAFEEEVAELLAGFARSLGMRPFPLEDEAKAAYHAGAASASNFVVTVLGVAADLLAAAGVPLRAARPLTESAVADVYDRGFAAALTGPIARGDVGTVRGQLAAARAVSEGLGREYALLVRATARHAGRPDVAEAVLGDST